MNSFLCWPLLLAGLVSAGFRFQGMNIGPVHPDTEHLSKRYDRDTRWGTFDQQLDHTNPKLGTFKQRYWYSTEFWKGPGSPIIVTTPGEQSASGFNSTYFGLKRLPGLFAQQLGAAVILLEHRYWGQSSPFESLTVKNLQYLTLENAIKDLSFFATNFALPFDTSGGSAPSEAPWIFTGGSYAGALAGWSAVLDPGTFWAYHGSSSVVQTISDFWTYLSPVIEATPQNCSADIQAVISHVDKTLLHGSPQQKRELKAKFQLDDLTDADFGATLEYGPWSWQSNQFHSINTLGFSPYHRFCDYVEGVYLDTNFTGYSQAEQPDAKGVGVEKALEGYAQWVVDELLPGLCNSYNYPEFQGTMNTACLQNQNASNPLFHDLAVNNTGNRQWNWMLCNEPFEWWQAAAPHGHPTFVSRLVNAAYWRDQCASWFPPEHDGHSIYTYSLALGKRASDIDKWTGGWFGTNTTRAMFANGEFDPWRGATLSASGRPGGPVNSTEKLPVRVLKGGTHCSDMYAPNWEANEGAKRAADEQVEEMKGWVAEFYREKGKIPPSY